MLMGWLMIEVEGKEEVGLYQCRFLDL